VDPHPLVVDPVGRPEVLDVVRAVATDHRGVLARDVAVLDREVARLRAAPDDELVLVHRITLPVVDEEERARARDWRRRRLRRGCRRAVALTVAAAVRLLVTARPARRRRMRTRRAALGDRGTHLRGAA